jgi:GT2 family glycosyltransferase
VRSSRPATGYLPAAGMFVDREAFVRLGGFPDSEVMSIDFCDRARVAGYDLLHEPAMAVLRTDEPTTLSALLQQEMRIARAVRVFYPGLGLAWIPLMALLWWPFTVACLALYAGTGNVLFLGLSFAGLVAPPAAIAARRGLPHARSASDVALMLLVAATYLTGRVLGRFWPRS